MNILWRSNSTKYRLIRTILQGIISVVIINLDLLLGYLIIPNQLRPVLTALVMAILSPMMSELGKMLEEKESE